MFNPFALVGLKFKLAAAAIAVVVLFGLYTWRVHVERDYGRAEVQLKWDADKGRQKDAALAAQQANALETQRRLDEAAKAERTKNEALIDANRRVGQLLGELRNRPQRPASGSAAASHPAAGAACTGSGLYRPDAEFLAGEAAAAAVIASQRDYCHDRYDALTKPME